MPVAKKKFLSKYYSGMSVVPKRTPGTPSESEADEEEHDDEPLKSITPLENADDPSLVRPFFFFLESDSCVLFLFIGVWEGESFNCLSIQQRNIPSVNFYGTNPSVELAMIKIKEKIAATKVSFSF